jgi:hypothetical protein
MPWIAWGFTLIGTCLLAFGFPEAGYAFLAICLTLQLLVLNQQRKKILPVEDNIDPLPLDAVSLKKPQLGVLSRVMAAWEQQIQVASDLIQHNIEGLIQPFNDMTSRMREENKSSLSLFGTDTRRWMKRRSSSPLLSKHSIQVLPIKRNCSTLLPIWRNTWMR